MAEQGMLKTFPAVVDSSNPASHVLQIINLSGSFSNSWTVSFWLSGNLEKTFFDVEEINTNFFDKIPNNKRRNHTFTLKEQFVNNYINCQFALKGFFENLNISVYYRNEINLNGSLESNNLLYVIIFVCFVFACLGILFKKLQLSYIWFTTIIYYTILNSQKSDVSILIPSRIRINLVPSYFVSDSSYYDAQKVAKEFKFSDSYNSTQCKICRFNATRSIGLVPNSTPRDLIVSAVVKPIKNLDVFIRSIRTVNCKATVVIFTDGDVDEFNEMFAGCDIHFIEIKIPKPHNFLAKQTIRFKLISSFLSQFPDDYFDRIVYADFYDTVFQGDPFTQAIDNKTVMISIEHDHFGNQSWSMNWFKNGRMHGFPEETVAKYMVICSGAYIGTAPAMKFIFNTVANWIPSDYFDTTMNDQSYYTVLIFSGVMEKLGYQIVQSEIGGPVTSCNLRQKWMNQSMPAFRNNWIDGAFPLLFHQFNRLSQYEKRINELCRAP